MNLKRRIGFFVIGVCLAAPPAPSAIASDTLDRIKKEGSVRVGLTNQQPLAFIQPDGSPAGIEVEITKAIFSNMGVQKIEPVVMDWGSMIPGLKANRIDIVIAGMFIKPARCEQVAFSNPDYQAFDTLVVLKGNPKNIHSFDDALRNSDILVAAIQGGASAMTAKRAGIPDSRLQVLPGYVEMFAALKAGRVHAVSIDTVSAGQFLAADTQNIERAEPFQVPIFDGAPARSYGAFVFRPEDQDLVAIYNKFLADFVGSPEQLAMLKKYGLGASDVPPRDVTAAKACSK
jgi:polar amino acid transport system substrate-binding protein